LEKKNDITKDSFKNYSSSRNHTGQHNDPNPSPNNTSSRPIFDSPTDRGFFTLQEALRQKNDNVAYIYATSSNFRHSGPWHNHICTINLSLTFHQLYNIT
jgi:hypothetical protein